MKKILVIMGIAAACVLMAGIFIFLRPPAETLAGPAAPAAPLSTPAPTPVDITALKTRAEQGDPASQAQLGKAYLNANGVRQDFKQAAYWYGLSASNGNVEAQATMGELFQAGQGVPLDGAAAERWFTKAGEHGSVTAQYDLGYMYERGMGAKRDQKAAAHWYQLAAEAGDALAQYNYGQRCLSGIGVAKDPVEGLKWMILAAAQGQADAKGKLDSAQAAASQDQLAEAKNRAAAFKLRAAGQ